MKLRLEECKTRRKLLVLKILPLGSGTPDLPVRNFSDLSYCLSHLTEKLLPLQLLFWLENPHFPSQIDSGPVYCYSNKHWLPYKHWLRASGSFPLVLFTLLMDLCTAWGSFWAHRAAQLHSQLIPGFFIGQTDFCLCTHDSFSSLGMSGEGTQLFEDSLILKIMCFPFSVFLLDFLLAFQFNAVFAFPLTLSHSHKSGAAFSFYPGILYLESLQNVEEIFPAF